jgi:hypothetical protein
MAAARDIAHEQKQAVDGLVEPAIAKRVARQRTPGDMARLGTPA